MADYEYERDEQLLEARRLKRLELRRKRQNRQRIFYGGILAILVLIIVLIVKSCGGEKKPKEPVVPKEEPTVTQPEAKTTKATLSAVGDIMVYDTQLADAKQSDGTYNFLTSLAPVAELLTASDLTVGNFEANFAGEPFAGYPNFSAPPALADTLAGVGFDVLQTANTYSIQNGLSGLSSTINTIRSAGMGTLGSYLSADDETQNGVLIKEVNGIKFAFVGFTKGLNNMRLPVGSEYCVDMLYTDYDSNYNKIDKTAILARMEAAKATAPDVIVAMVHWGSEYESIASATQEEIADLLVENGADVILGSHSHIVGPMEQRTANVGGVDKDIFIAYSLGNFLSGMTNDYTQESAILNLEFTKDSVSGKTTISGADYVPLYMMDNGEDAINRFEIVNIYNVLADAPDAAVKQTLESALKTLTTNTKSNLARKNTVTPSVSPDADTNQGGATE